MNEIPQLPRHRKHLLNDSLWEKVRYYIITILDLTISFAAKDSHHSLYQIKIPREYLLPTKFFRQDLSVQFVKTAGWEENEGKGE